MAPDPNALLNAVLTDRKSMAPIATDHQPVLKSLPEIRAVIFDVYGTLVVSGSGDVGTVNAEDRGAQIMAAMQAVGMPTTIVPTIDQLQHQIRSSNEARRSEDCPNPEVDIVSIWRGTLESAGITTASIGTVVRLAAAYEAKANPTWPMPGSKEVLSWLASTPARLGIVSNAQVFTPLLVHELGDLMTADSIFDKNLCVFSNRYRQSKPGPRLFSVLSEALGRVGIEPQNTIYVGNDMLNDVWAASQAEMKTAWFVGDRRSCRPRSDDDRCRDLQSDLVVTSLMQLKDCLEIQ